MNYFGHTYRNAASPLSRQERNLICSFGSENHLHRARDCKDQAMSNKRSRNRKRSRKLQQALHPVTANASGKVDKTVDSFQSYYIGEFEHDYVDDEEVRATASACLCRRCRAEARLKSVATQSLVQSSLPPTALTTPASVCQGAHKRSIRARIRLWVIRQLLKLDAYVTQCETNMDKYLAERQQGRLNSLRQLESKLRKRNR